MRASVPLVLGLTTLLLTACASGGRTPLPPVTQRAQEARLREDERLKNDWAYIQRYTKANAELPAPAPGEDRVVFMGNSITESWMRYFPSMFPGKPYVNRGIGGQTTPQMVVRFRQDVIALKPKVVVILAGINDIAGNTGPATLEMIENNLASMAELAKANGIRVVLASVLPAHSFPWRPGIQPAPTVVALNQWMKNYARSNGEVYLDYHSAMVDERLGLRKDLSPDEVHPNEAGYRIMAPLTVSAIEEALATSGFVRQSAVRIGSTAREATKLFNGRDLTGWHVDVPAADSNVRVRAPFVVRNGLLVSLGEPRGHLLTDSSYRNYRLEIEYRFAASPGNAGVLVHASTPRALYRMFPRSIEVQMEHGNAGDFWCILEDIRVPDMESRRGPPADWGTTEGKARRIRNLTDNSEKPLGEWNTMVIEAVDRSIRVWVNGDLVNEGSSATADRGRIALQAEGSEVEFRRLSLIPLRDETVAR